MDSYENLFSRMALPEEENRKCSLVYLKIIFFPSIIYFIFLLGYFEIINFKVEIHSIVLMGIIFLISLIFARHNAELGCCLFQREQIGFKTSFKEYIIKHLLQIGNETRSSASFNDFINEYSKDFRNNNYASVASAVFPTLGILGTFISIAISMPNFSSQNTDALEREISILLSGVGTAFYVSIYGIALALWWIFFEKRGLSRFDKLVEKYRKFTKEYFWTKDEIDLRYMQKNLEHFTRIDYLFEQMNNKEFIEKLNSTISSKFKLFDEIIKLEEEMIEVGSKYIKETSTKLVSSQDAQQDIAQLYSEFLVALGEFSIKLNEMNSKIFEQQNKIQESSDKKIDKLQYCVNELSDNVALFSQTLERLNSSTLDAQKDILNSFRLEIADSLSSLHINDDETREINTDLALQNLKESLAEIDKEAKDIIKNLDKMK